MITPEKHKKRHEELHRALDELVADFIVCNADKHPSNTTVLELVQWSHRQTIAPTEK